jgi:hypothetical protein
MVVGSKEGLDYVRSTVTRWWPTHWTLVEAQLSACATLMMRDVGQSLALFAIGPSGVGKSTALKMFGVAEREALISAEAGLPPLVEQLDNFTLASFLSHYSEEKSEDLEKQALFRWLKHRILLTPELALMFRGKRESLEMMFSKLALVLDGEGIRTASGTHGVLGEKGDFTFVWLAGTTPFRMESWRTMAQLGTRLLFYRVSDDAADVLNKDYFRAREECNVVVSEFLSTLLDRRRSLPWPDMNGEIRVKMQRLSDLLADGQAQRSDIGEDEPIRPSPNHFRMRIEQIVCGRALLHGRSEVTEEDLPLARHIVRSSMPGSRGPVLLTIFDEGTCSASQLVAATGLSHAYVLKTLKALRDVEVISETLEGGWTLA